MHHKQSATNTITKKMISSSLLKNEEQQEEEDFGVNIFICENTDYILNPLEQMTYALNETQVEYGSVVILKNAP
jgi:hypothetical protein